ncbi:MAG: SLC13 family permease [Planctomycetota bacterium]|nr:MAG: SLC13 family permease [Planctomycetota bacterium]
MTWQILTTLAVLLLVTLALCLLNVGPDMVLLGGLTILMVAGIVDPQHALAGFGNEGLITVAVLYAVAEGLRQTGGIDFLGGLLLGKPKNLRHAQLRVMLPAALASAFLNNTPVLAMLMPVVIDWARRIRLSVSHVLLPLSYATILGGMCTLIGTSTTLVLNGELIKLENGRGLGLFEIGQVGLPCAAVGLLFLLAASPKLIPERKPAFTPLDDPREFTVEMIVEPNSSLPGKTIEAAGLRHLPGMFLVEIERRGEILAAVAPDEKLQANDRLVFVGIVDSVVDLRRIPGLRPAEDHQFSLQEERGNRILIEAVVSTSCPFLGMTIRDARFRSHYNAAVLAVARDGRRISGKIGDIRLRAGDTLLLEATPTFLKQQRHSRDFFLVSEVANSESVRHEKAWVARLILAAMVVAVATELLPMLQAALIAAGLMLATRCCRGVDVKRAIDWGVLIVIGAGLGIGEAIKASGTDAWVADGLAALVGQDPRRALAAVFVLTSVLTNLITAKAAAVLVLPIALATAQSMHVDMMPFVVTVMIAAAASFATPIGYQTNLMVFGPGGYRYSDYLRLGLPLTILIGATTVLLAPVFWPFGG